MRPTDRPRFGAAVAVAGGFVAVILATAFGWNSGLLDAVVTPPAIIRAFLVGLAVAVGAVLLLRSVARMSESGRTAGGPADVPGLINREVDVSGPVLLVRDVAFRRQVAQHSAYGRIAKWFS